MKIAEFKKNLESLAELNFIQPNGHFVPRHFHITEAGIITRHFIDCGGQLRMQKTVNFQIWVADDIQHRLSPEKLKKIIAVAEPLFANENPEVEVEYQSDTISRYGLDFNGSNFLLTPTFTDCLAKDKCGIPPAKQKLSLSELQNNSSSCCSPGSGCC